MIIIDTGPMVALFDKDDKYHKRCKKVLAQIREPLITTWPVITEVMYLLNFSFLTQELCLEFIESGGIDIHAENSNRISLIHQIMKKYKDLPIDFADASLLILAEEKGIKTIFTLDNRDFRAFAPKHVDSFHIIPG